MSFLSLPEAFTNRMKEQLKDEYDAFISSYDQPRLYGLRCNLLKADLDSFPTSMPFTLKPVNWAKEGFYYPENQRPGRHAFHEAGVYYIQEPSAMSAVALLDPIPGDRVADLCAAPGGKSTQIAARLGGQGLLVTNEIIPSRAAVLSSNIERMGVRNALVTNESTDKLTSYFPAFFDKILVDAPCSGEGMFRKDDTAIKEWSPENVDICAERQKEILDNAATMSKPGGIIVYSTCTFSKAENEDNVDAFLSRHPEFTLVSQERLMPHKVDGEGHFVAKFKKAGGTVISQSAASGPVVAQTAVGSIAEAVTKAGSEAVHSGKKSKKDSGNQGNFKATDISVIRSFLIEECKITVEAADNILSKASVTAFGENIYLTPEGVNNIKGLTVVRPGLHVCKDLKNRFEPAHSLAMSLRPHEVTAKVNLSIEEANKYIEGQTVSADPSIKGWVCIFTEGFSIGWGKASNGVVKNHYPKGLRMSLS